MRWQNILHGQEDRFAGESSRSIMGSRKKDKNKSQMRKVLFLDDSPRFIRNTVHPHQATPHADCLNLSLHRMYSREKSSIHTPGQSTVLGLPSWSHVGRRRKNLEPDSLPRQWLANRNLSIACSRDCQRWPNTLVYLQRCVGPKKAQTKGLYCHLNYGLVCFFRLPPV